MKSNPFSFLWKFFPLVFFLFMPFYGSGQSLAVDSLLQVVNQENDSIKIHIFLKLGWSYVYNQPDSAIHYFWKAIGVSDRHPDRFALATGYNRIGVAYDIKSIPDSALYYYDIAMEVAETLSDSVSMAGTLNNIGLIYWNKFQLDSAMIFYKKAADVFEAINNQKGYASALNNIGLLHDDSSMEHDAIKYHYQALAIRKRIKDTYGIGASYANLGMSYSGIPERDSAVYYFQKAIEVKKSINDLYGLSKVMNNLGLMYRKEGNDSEALKQFEESLKVKRKLGDRLTIASTLVNLAPLQSDQEKYQEAIQSLEEGIRIAEELKNNKLLFKLYSQYGDNLAMLDQHEEAYKANKRSLKLKDSVFHNEMSERYLELETQYENEKQAQEIKLKNLEIANQKAKTRNQAILGISLFALLIASGLFLYYRFFVKIQLERRLKALEIREKLGQERERISRDLHDNVGSQLTQIINKLDIAGFKLRKQENQQSSQQIEQISDTARETIDQLRDTIWAIQKDEFQLSDFEHKVRLYLNQYLDGLENPKNFDLQVLIDENPSLSSHQALHAFRIIQEATQNVVKHAEADHLLIRMESRTDDEISLLIQDDGKGFDGSNQPEGHYGMQNMKARSEAIDGHIQIESLPGKGTSIRIRFPIIKTAV